MGSPLLGEASLFAETLKRECQESMMRWIGWIAVAIIALVVMTGSNARVAHPAASLRAAAANHAPPIRSAQWINSRPLTDADLRGHVVLVEFWTYECINCQRTIPAMRTLDTLWTPRGVVILGIHRPEFREERSVAHVRAAVKAAGIAYPVCLDNDTKLWDAFHNDAWPSFYLLDESGAIRWTHVGELHEGDAAWRDLQAVLHAL